MIDHRSLSRAVSGSPFWESYLASAKISGAVRVHLAVLIEPYLGYVLDGSKTIESRFTRNNVAPYRRVQAGDVLLLKRASGPIEGICRAADAWFYQLQPDSWSEIRERFGDCMRVSDDYLADRSKALYATLIRLEDVQRIPAVSVRKRDRRGWVVLHEPAIEAIEQQTELDI